MDTNGHIYMLTDEQRQAMAGDGYEGTKVDGVRYESLRQDVARLEGFLRGRAESDAPKRGAGANKDLAG